MVPQESPIGAIAYGVRSEARKALQDYEGAKMDLEDALLANSRSPMMLNNLAWLLATCPRAELRDGARAVALATQACELSQWKHPSHLGTLGAAYAAVGRSHEAVTMQMRALQSPEYRKEHGEKAQERLELYAAGKPFHEQETAGSQTLVGASRAVRGCPTFE
jgi:tetratricopeptide (TPR) repeat protein